MSEKILHIYEHSDKKDKWCTQSGYLIKTDKQEIKILIDDYQSCCEEYGYISSEDNFENFIGSDYIGISLVDTAFNSTILERCPKDYDSGGICFVNIETSVGTLQFAVYNAHNGYYGHEIKVVSNELEHEDVL